MSIGGVGESSPINVVRVPPAAFVVPLSKPYEAQRGDNLGAMLKVNSYTNYGPQSADAFRKVAQLFNPHLTDPDKINPGETYNIPSRFVLEQARDRQIRGYPITQQWLQRLAAAEMKTNPKESTMDITTKTNPLQVASQKDPEAYDAAAILKNLDPEAKPPQLLQIYREALAHCAAFGVTEDDQNLVNIVHQKLQGNAKARDEATETLRHMMDLLEGGSNTAALERLRTLQNGFLKYNADHFKRTVQDKYQSIKGGIQDGFERVVPNVQKLLDGLQQKATVRPSELPPQPRPDASDEDWELWEFANLVYDFAFYSENDGRHTGDETAKLKATYSLLDERHREKALELFDRIVGDRHEDKEHWENVFNELESTTESDESSASGDLETLIEDVQKELKEGGDLNDVLLSVKYRQRHHQLPLADEGRFRAFLQSLDGIEPGTIANFSY